jgi:hypothetical protein
MVEEFTKLSLDIARQCIPTKTITVRDYDKPWFNNEIRKEIRLRDRLRINVFKFGRESDTLKYKKKTKKTRNKVNNMKKKAKENFESSLDNILLDNSTNPKTYWKIMKMQNKSNKGSNCIHPLRNTINDEHLDEMVYDDDKKCELLNKYFSLVSKLEEENIPVPPFESKTNDSITDIFVTASEIVDIIQILDLKKASGPDKISHKGGTGIFSSSNLDTKLKYLFNSSHLLSSSYTISSKCSSLIVFRSGGIQLLPLLDLISIFIIFQ